jgi:exopolysaccharide production protein ExoZ
MAAMAGGKQDRLAGIEAGRGIAALLVVAVHAGDHVRYAYGPYFLGDLTIFGHSGVDFFFVLSGFIIMHVHRGDIGRPGRLWNYIKRRVTRIYPFYWLVLAGSLVLAMVVKGASLPSPARLVVDIALLPSLTPLSVTVAWTLQFEMTFYACFAVMIINARIGVALFVAWFGYIALGVVLGMRGETALTTLLTDYFGGHFFLGMLAAWVVSRWSIPRPGVFLAVGVAWFAATGAGEDAGMFVPTVFLPHLSYALASMLAVIGLVGCERAGRLRVPRLMTVLGGATYAIYLTHDLTIGAVWQILVRTGLDQHLHPTIVLALLWTAAAVAGVVVCHLVERPAMAVARALLDGTRRPGPLRPRTAGTPPGR